MPTQAEELQAKEFLKRAEVRTMKKDLQALRETDALKERLKIVNVKTLEEQKQEEEKKLRDQEAAKAQAEKFKNEQVLGQNAVQERITEKDLKNYATEQERQQIFQLESQRLIFEKQADEIDQKKDPALKLQKNNVLLERGNWETKLNATKEDNRKLDTEENSLNERIGLSQDLTEKKALEQRRWEIEDQRKVIEKKTWEIEKQLEIIGIKILQTDKSAELLVAEKNSLNQKILGIDKQLREIYSGVIARVEEKRRQDEELKKAGQTEIAKARAEQNEKIQRQQWSGQAPAKVGAILNNIPVPVPARQKIEKTFEEELKQREKFLQDIKEGTDTDNTKIKK